MMRIAIAAAALVIMGSIAIAQDARQDANEEIARALTEIEEIMPSQQEMAFAEASAIQDRIDRAIQRVEALRDYLASNEYIRVAGFSLGVPLGISISFEFLD